MAGRCISEASLRQAGPADAATLLDLARRFHAEDGHPLAPAGERALARLLADPVLGLVLLLERDRVALGYAALCLGFSIEWGRDGFVDDVFLLPAERGAGLGARMLAALEQAALAAGCDALHLEVMPGNRAEGLYRRRGFVGRGSQLYTKPLRPRG